MKCKAAFNDYHVNHPGKVLTIYEIPSLGKIAFLESFTAKSSSAFSKPGNWPFNKLAFAEGDYPYLSTPKYATPPPLEI